MRELLPNEGIWEELDKLADEETQREAQLARSELAMPTPEEQDICVADHCIRIATVPLWDGRRVCKPCAIKAAHVIRTMTMMKSRLPAGKAKARAKRRAKKRAARR